MATEVMATHGAKTSQQACIDLDILKSSGFSPRMVICSYLENQNTHIS